VAAAHQKRMTEGDEILLHEDLEAIECPAMGEAYYK
jgi:hypothetical protein